MRRSMMSRWNPSVGLYLWASACAGQELSVGSQAGLGLDRCGGTAECGANLLSETVNTGELRTCPDSLGGTLRVDFRFDVNARLCPPLVPEPCGQDDAGDPQFCLPEYSGCSAHLLSAKAAPDGSIWVAAAVGTMGSKGEDRQTLWFGHVGADGTEQAFFKLASSSALRNSTVYYQTDIAVGADSDAYVVISGLDPGPNADAEVRLHTWLEHYDTQGQSLDGALDLPGLAEARLALTDDGRIVVAGDALHNEKRVIAALLDTDGSLRWSQPEVPSQGTPGVLGVGVDATGSVLVATWRTAPARSFGVVRFDELGAPLWDRTLAQSSAMSSAGFGADAQGNFVILGSPETSVTSIYTEGAWLVSLDKHGAARWSYRLPEIQPNLTVVRQTGDVYVPGTKNLIRISVTGDCTRIAYSPDDPYLPTYFEPGAGDTLYFADQGNVGRYRLLPNE